MLERNMEHHEKYKNLETAIVMNTMAAWCVSFQLQNVASVYGFQV